MGETADIQPYELVGDSEIRIGISACLLGEKVRFDGGHKRDSFLLRTVGPLVTFAPVCPEMEIGLGTPRESLSLMRIEGEVRLMGNKSSADHTMAMRKFTEQKLEALRAMDLSGFVVKKDSPSCGMERVRLYSPKRVAERRGIGMFTAALMDAFPDLPVEEEGRLHDPLLRENFFERVFAYRRMNQLFREGWSNGELVAFHTREKLLLLAHQPEGYRELGQLVAAPQSMARDDLEQTYRQCFMQSMRVKPTVGRHVNVMQHMAGFFKTRLDSDAKRELERVLDDFRSRLVPLVVPLTLIRHYVRVYGIDYLAGQSYLEPHPKELMLRNHV